MPAPYGTQVEIDRFRMENPTVGLSDHSIFKLLKQDNPNLRWDDTGGTPGTSSPRRRRRRTNTSPTYMNAFSEWFDYGINENSADFWKAAYNNSLTGLTEELITGKSRYNLKDYDPNILEDIASMAASFVMPLDLLAFAAGGKLVGQPLARLATAGMKKRVGTEFGKRALDSMIPAALAQAGTLATYEGAMGGVMAGINGENVLEGIGKGVMHGGIMGGAAGLAGGGLSYLNAKVLKGLKVGGKIGSEGVEATAKLSGYDRTKMLATGLPGQIAAEAGVFTAGETLETAIDPDRDVRLKDILVSLGKNIGLFSLLKGKSKLLQRGKDHVKLLEEHEKLKRTTNSLNKNETKGSKAFHNTYDVIVEKIAELEASGRPEDIRAAEALKEPRDLAKSKALNLDRKHFENRDELKELRTNLDWAEKNATTQTPQTSVENFTKIVKSLQALIEVESRLGDTGEYKALISEIEGVKKGANDLLNEANQRVIDFVKEQEKLIDETPEERATRVLTEAKDRGLKEIDVEREGIRERISVKDAPIELIEAALKSKRGQVEEKIAYKEAGAPKTYVQPSAEAKRTAPVAEKENIESGIYNETTKKFNSKKAEKNVQTSIKAVDSSKLSNEHKQILASAVNQSGRSQIRIRTGTSVAIEVLDFVERKYKKSIDKLSESQLKTLIVDFARDKTGYDIMGHKTEKQFRDMGLLTAEITSLRKEANRIHDGIRELFNPKYGTLHETLGYKTAMDMISRAGTKYSPGETTRYRVDVQGGIGGFKKWFSWLNKQKSKRINYAQGRSIDKGLANNLLKLAFDKGLRPTEAAEYLRAKDISVENGSIRIQRAKKGGGVDFVYDKKMARELHQYIEKNNLSPDAKLFGFKDTADYNKFIEHIAKKSGADIMVYDVQEGRFIEFGKQKEIVLGVEIEAGKGLQKGYALRAIYEREGERIDWAAEQVRLTRKTKPIQYKKSGAPITKKASKEQVESIAAGMQISAVELGEQVSYFKKKFPQLTINLKKTLGKYNGEYILGRITGQVVEIAKGRAGADTMPHEVAHHVVDVLREFGDKRSIELVKRGEKIFGGEEQLVQRVGEYAAGRLRNKSLASKAKSWIQEFWSNMKVKLGWYTEKDITRFLGKKLMTGKIPTGEIANFKAKHQTKGEAIEEKKKINSSVNREIGKGNIPAPVLREAKETIFGTSKLKDYTKWATVEQLREFNEFVHDPKNWHVIKVENINAEYNISPEVSKQHLRDLGIKNGIAENTTLQAIKQYKSFLRENYDKPIYADNSHDWILNLSDRQYKVFKVLGRAITPVWLVLKNHGGKAGRKISEKLLNHEWAEHVIWKGPGDEGIHIIRKTLGRKKSKLVHLFDIERTEARLNRKKGDEYYTKKGELSPEEREFYKNMKRKGTEEYEAYNVWTNREKTGLADFYWDQLFQELSEHHTPSEIAKLKKELDSKRVEGYMTRVWTKRALQTIKEDSPWMLKMVENNLKDAARAEANLWGKNKSKEEISNKRRELEKDEAFKDKIRGELYDAVRFGYAIVKNPHLIQRGALMPEYVEVTNEKNRLETVKIYEDAMQNTAEAYVSRMSKFLSTIRYFPEWTGLGSKYKLGESKRLQVEALETDDTVGAYAALAIKRQLGVDKSHLESLNRPLYKGAAALTNASALVGLSSPLSGVKNTLIGIPRSIGDFGLRNTFRGIIRYFDSTARADARIKGQLEYGSKSLELERIGWGRFNMAKHFKYINWMTPTENINRIVSSHAGQLYFGETLATLRGKKGMFKMFTTKDRMRRVMSELWHLTPEEINLLETSKDFSSPEISQKYGEIMHKVGHFSHVSSQGGTSTVLLPLWMSSKEGRPLTLFQRMAMSTTIDSYRNFVKPLIDYGNPAPLIRATMAHAVSGGVLFWIYKELLGKEPPTGSRLQQDDLFDKVLMNLWRSEFLGVAGEILDPYDRDQVAPVMEPVVIRNLTEAKENLHNLLTGGKTFTQAIGDYTRNTVVVWGQAADLYKKSKSPYYEKFRSTRSWTNKFKIEKEIPKYSPDGLVTRRQSFYRDLRDSIFFGSEKDIALSYWSSFNTIVTELEKKNPKSSKAWREKQAKTAIKQMITHFNPLNISDTMQGTPHTLKKEFLNWLTPENKKIAMDTEKDYHYKIRLYNRYINKPIWRRKFSAYI